MSGPIRHWVPLVLAGTVLFASVWIVWPAPIRLLLPLSVGAPEVSPWLVAAAALALLAALADARHARRSRIAVVVALVALAIPARVLSEIPSTVRAFDRDFTAAFGTNALAHLPADVRGRLRPQPIAALDLFRGLPHVDVRETHDVPFARNDDVALALDVYQPSDNATHAVIIQMYGGGWRSGAPGDNHAFARALAASGHVVFAIDYRHTPRWQWPAQLVDVRAALAWIATHAAEYGGDATRVVLMGRSSGAELALIAAISSGAPSIRGIVAYYSPIDLTEGYWNPGQPDTLDVRELEHALIGGTPTDKPDAYRDASPISYADRPHPPVLLINGGHDRIVYQEHAAALYDHLRRSGTCLFLVIPWANHAFDAVPFGPSAQMALYYTERFVDVTMREGR